MVKQFENLSESEQDLLLKAPALVSVMSSCSFNSVNDLKKDDAIKLSHIKTFTADPLLLPYYQEVEKNFREQFDAIVARYFPFDHKNRQELQNEISELNKVIGKLESKFGNVLRRSLDHYAKHVRNAHTVIRDFMFPIPIPGLSF